MLPSRRITSLSGEHLRDEYSMYFDATNNNRVNCGSDSSLDVGTSSFSVSAWFKAEDSGGSKDYWPIVSKGDSLSPGDGWAVTLVDSSSHTKKIYFDVASSAGGGTRQSGITSADAYTLGTWNHYVATMDQDNDGIKQYLNGTRIVTTGSITLGDITDGSMNFFIGNDNDSRDYEGYISDVAFYKGVVLNASQVATIYNGGEPYNHKEGVASAYLKGWWRMGDGKEGGSGSTVYDMSGNGNDGTVENGPVFSTSIR